MAIVQMRKLRIRKIKKKKRKTKKLAQGHDEMVTIRKKKNNC